MTPVFAGLDLGGTKTDVLVRTGTTSRNLRLGGGNLRLDDADTWARRIAGVLLETNPHGAPVYVCVGAAGGGSRSAARTLEEALAQRIPILAGARVVSDTRIAWEAAFTDRPGIIVIAGTGSGCFAVDADGTEYRTGGWGPAIGDPGSGRSIGTSAIRHTLAAVESRTWSLLARRVVEQILPDTSTDTLDTGAVLDAVYTPGFAAADLAGTVIAACDEGCPDARDVLLDEARSLAAQCGRLVTQLPADPGRIALVGGLTRLPAYAHILEAALHGVLPKAELHPPDHPPVMGALRLAERLSRG